MSRPEDRYDVVLTGHAYYDSYLTRVDSTASFSEANAHIERVMREEQEERWPDPFQRNVEHRLCGGLHLVVAMDHEAQAIRVITVMIRGPTIYGFDEPWVMKLDGRALSKLQRGEW